MIGGLFSNVVEMPPCISPCVKFEIVANQLNDKDLACLDSFEMTYGTNELDKELVNREL
jgi:hypothetical protein